MTQIHLSASAPTHSFTKPHVANSRHSDGDIYSLKAKRSFWELPIFQYVKDPASSFTHFSAMIMALIGMVPLLKKAMAMSNPVYPFSMAVFMVSMILLYGASTAYHTFDLSEKTNQLLKKCDHMMIFVMIAGSYTPICLIVLERTQGLLMFAAVWAMAFSGMFLKAVWVNCPKWVSSVIYIAMGWSCIFSMSQIYSAMQGNAFYWLLTGGIMYTIGGVIYALKLSLFNHKYKNFGSHEIFHVFVMLGSICHFIVMYAYVCAM